MVIYILTKFGDNWLIFVDARMLTSKLWTDGHSNISCICNFILVYTFYCDFMELCD